MDSPKTKVGKFVHWVAYPIEYVIKKIRIIKHHNKKIFSIVLGTMLFLVGAFGASMQQHFLPHFLWDGLAYGVHGMGAAPMIKVFFEWLGLEI